MIIPKPGLFDQRPLFGRFHFICYPSGFLFGIPLLSALLTNIFALTCFAPWRPIRDAGYGRIGVASERQ
jgi:hypothetical protein